MKIVYFFVSLVAILAFAACDEASATDQPTPTPTPTATAIAPATATATASPVSTATATAVPPTATATPGFAMPKPPPATLTIGGKEQTSGIGTYCWMNGTPAGLCADYVGIITPKTPLVIQSPVSATIKLPLTQAPSTFSMRATLMTQADEMTSNSPDIRIWDPRRQGKELKTTLAAEQKVDLTLQPGLYVISIFTAWQGYGDVVYGFLVEVK